MKYLKAETPNQIALLRALNTKGAKLIGNGWSTPHRVELPGAPRPVLEVSKQTVRAAIKRGWLKGSTEDGYTITGWGVYALGAAS